MPDPRFANDPFQGVTLEMIVTRLVAHYGWQEMGSRINIRCFNFDPSVKSSLKFLRKTPWARTKVEELYLHYLWVTAEKPKTDAETEKPETPEAPESTAGP